MRVKSIGARGNDDATMKHAIDRKASTGNESWAAAAVSLRGGGDDGDDKRCDIGSENGTKPSRSSSFVEHKVLPTDTLQGLCLAYKISATRLRMENNFSGNSLQLAPKTLRIPIDPERAMAKQRSLSLGKKCIDYVSSLAKKGTSSSSLSDEVREVPEAEGAALKSAADEAGKPPAAASVLDLLCVCSSSSVEVSGGSDAEQPSSSPYVEHEVLPTDTLQGICLAYGVSATRLRMENKFSGNTLLMAPRKLRIPVNLDTRKGSSSGGASEEAREAVPPDDDCISEEKASSIPPPPPDVETSKRRLGELIESLSSRVDDHGQPVLTKAERTFLGLLLESNDPGVGEACVAAHQRLLDGNLFGSHQEEEGREGVNGEGAISRARGAPSTAAAPPASAVRGSTKKRLDRLEQRRSQSTVRFQDQQPAAQKPADTVLFNSAHQPLSPIQDVSHSKSNGDSSDAAEMQRVDDILRSFSDQEDDISVAEQASFEKASEGMEGLALHEPNNEGCADQKRPADIAAGDLDEPSRRSSARSMTSNSDESEDNDCPICLCPIESYDYSHPLQCPTPNCQFNCCMDCLERMIKSTKDESIEASDGNTFRISLQCPNCRNAHLGISIRDTLLLRKVDKCLCGADGLEVTDEKLSASELRFKEALEKDTEVASAIAGARHREDMFFGRDVMTDGKSFDNNLDALDASERLWAAAASGSLSEPGSIWSFDDEEGIEADLTGPHKAFVCRHHSREKAAEVEVEEPLRLEDVQADTTLLGGLHAFMSDLEQQFVTAHLISGDTTRVATAVEMMHYVSELSRQSVQKPNFNQRQVSVDKSVRTKVKEVIQEGNEARRKEEEKVSRNSPGAMAKQLATSPFGTRAGGRRVMKRQADLEMRKQIQYMELHPLPLRMPKYAVVTANSAELAGLTFWDDMWDGTVLDAFSKITVTKSLLGNNITVTKQPAEHAGIRHVIDQGSPKSRGKGYIDTYKPRVIVASISRDLGQQGVVKGDVLSHFNGELFSGTASELTELLDGRFEGEVFTLVFNADSAVAEALKRRSMI